MNLEKDQLLNKFPFLSKFKDQIWIKDNTKTLSMDFKEMPLHCAFLLIQDMVEFLDDNRFSNNWEGIFSSKVRLQQIERLLRYFIEADDKEKSKKGVNL